MTDEEAVELFYVSREVASKMEKFYTATCKSKRLVGKSSCNITFGSLNTVIRPTKIAINFGIQDGPESGQSVKVTAIS